MLELIAIVLVGVVGTAVATVHRRNDVAAPDGPDAVPTLVGAKPAVTTADGGAAVAGAPAAPAPPPDLVGRMVHGLRRRPWARRGLSLVSVGLIVGAVGMLGYPVYTNWYADRKQAELERQLASDDLRAAYMEGRLEEGDSLTRIIIPKIDVDVIVVEGVGNSALRAGAGHYPKSALPCEDGNVGIAGHRTTYGRPFHNLDLLEVGDTIILETPVGSCSYEITAAPFVVSPHDVEVVDDTPGQANLTLTTCHPKGSARQRLIVTAAKVADRPVDA